MPCSLPWWWFVFFICAFSWPRQPNMRGISVLQAVKLRADTILSAAIVINPFNSPQQSMSPVLRQYPAQN